MVQAAARGAVDFGKADVLDRDWWRRLWLVLDQVEADSVVRVRALQHAQHAAALDYHSGEKAFDKHWDGCNEATNQIRAILLPWLGEGEGAGDALRQAWVNKYGDPSDPEVAAKISSTAAMLRKRRSDYYAKRKKAKGRGGVR